MKVKSYIFRTPCVNTDGEVIIDIKKVEKTRCLKRLLIQIPEQKTILGLVELKVHCRDGLNFTFNFEHASTHEIIMGKVLEVPESLTPGEYAITLNPMPKGLSIVTLITE